ncbi:LuxR C-terminal-related transcriptional regulator [Embleya sp. MST-111070]|uniref:helix-turn-helix transcriptional regulator n=1 Tax=Embleya sp. MST-111070 TaxID=3398231 RepID=UPI003F73A0EE
MTTRRPLVDQVGGQLRRAGAVAVVGPTGFGKSQVLDDVCTAWQAAGDPVVRLSSARADAQIAYAPLMDLFSACPAEVRGELSDLQRSAMDWVLRRVGGPEPDTTTFRVTVLSCLHAWGRRARPLLAADDVQWWGPGSLDVFGFAARRSRGSVSLLAALRPDGPSPHDVLGGGAVEIGIPPLGPQESVAVVRSFGIPLRAAARIHTATGGSPRLVSDIAAGLARAGIAISALDATPLAPYARHAMRARLADLAEPVRRVLLLAALAADPTPAGVRRAAGSSAEAALAAAEAAGVVRVTAGAVVFAAPVVREGIVAEAGGEAVRRAHRVLAAASLAADDRAWHAACALGATETAPDLVPGLADAAATARGRGDHIRAAEFALLAVDRAGGNRPDLLVTAARDAEAAGRFDLARTALDRLVRTRAGPAARARARFAVLDAAGRGAALLADVAAQALADATAAAEPALVSAAHLRLAWSAHLDRGYPADALTHAEHAVAWAERAGDPAGRAAALTMAARIQQGRGTPDHVDTLRRALAAGAEAEAEATSGRNPQGRRPPPLHRTPERGGENSPEPRGSIAPAPGPGSVRRTPERGGGDAPEPQGGIAPAPGTGHGPNPGPDASPTPGPASTTADHGPDPATAGARIIHDPRRVALCFALLEGRPAEAERLLAQLRPLVGDGNGPADLVRLLGSAVQLHAHTGDGRTAREEAARLVALARDVGASPGPPWYAAATAELAGGTLEQALGYAELGLAASEEETDSVFAAHCLHLSGAVRLFRRDTAGALADLLRVRDLTRELCIGDPAAIPYHADLAEALVAAGDVEAATRTVAEVRDHAKKLARRSVLAALDRAEALCHAAAGRFTPAEESLTAALAGFERLAYPLECGRVLLARSAVEHRRRRPARARESYAAAEAVFRAAGAPLWAPAPPDRAGAPAGLAGLTEAEQRIVDLVADGRGNRDIANSLYVSVKTVEAMLTRIYRKLGVRSRVQMVALVHRELTELGHRDGRRTPNDPPPSAVSR